jgi:hypothetical protein
MSERFAADWLKLRESADLAARDPALARRFAAALPSGAKRLIDLGAGTGANTRALLPRIVDHQEWILVERDRDLIAAQDDAFTTWARRQGYPIQTGGGRITIEAKPVSWRVAAQPLDLACDLEHLAAIGAHGVTAAAFFDLVSQTWLERFVAVLAKQRLPLLAVLTVDGRRVWQPPNENDAIVAEAFAHHQRGDIGFGVALGGGAVDALQQLLDAAGFSVTRVVSDWRLSLRDHALLASLIDGEAAAARAAAPEAHAAIDAWEAQRQAQLAAGTLALTVGHCDLLAMPA